MHTWHRTTTRLVLALSLTLLFTWGVAPNDARAADGGVATPCGNFDFGAGISCKIKVGGGCTADCSPFTFKAACSGMCNATSDTTCVNNCGTQCVAMCNPALLDCFAGCHAECDAPTVDLCKQKHPGDDCASTAKAQCDIHCNDSCKVPPNSCAEHCNKCCTGSCNTQVNFDCDFSCFVDVRGGCEVQCQRPEGALFCNDQYVHSSDVKACIDYLLAQGIKVDASATAMASCDLTGCHDSGSSKGCGIARGSSDSTGGGALALLLLAGLGTVLRPPRRQKTRAPRPSLR